jgi:pimeloyl-ACP methyl ester carboxylesterase
MHGSDGQRSTTVHSADGTVIAYDLVGSGPPLLLVDAAAHFRAFSSFGGIIGALAADFSVVHYDRRGRGESTDVPPYAVQREVEDLAALIDTVGSPAVAYAASSGGLLALHAVAAGLPIARLALLEPPIEPDGDSVEQAAFTANLAALVEAGQHEEAVAAFVRGIGVPEETVDGMRGTSAWQAMASVAPTLVYDSIIGETPSAALLASVLVPTLVLSSEGSDAGLTGMAAAAVAGLPNGRHQSLPGTWHGVDDEALVPALRAFLLH